MQIRFYPWSKFPQQGFSRDKVKQTKVQTLKVFLPLR
jgi:hypothetical protein